MVLRGCVWLCSVGDIWAKTECVPRFLGFSPGFLGVVKWVRVFTVKPSVATHQPLKFKKANFPN